MRSKQSRDDRVSLTCWRLQTMPNQEGLPLHLVQVSMSQARAGLGNEVISMPSKCH